MSDAPAPIKLSDQDAKLLALYAEGLLTDEQARALNVRLHEAPELITIIAHFTEIEEHTRALLIEEQATERGDWYAVMTELAKAEAQAQTELVHLESDKPKTLKLRTDNPSLREIGWAIGYLGKQPRVWAPIAAALAIALTLVFIFAGNPNAAPIATTPNDSDKPVITDVRVVATLTAQHDAQWLGQADGALAPGSQLRPGDRLTLTQGYAKVTTQRGAIAILEAPTSIELTDSDNAIRLHAGKLVGICETASSLGFTVYTPDGRIVDTGTRFGVIHKGKTSVRVIEGEVVLTAKQSEASTPPTTLSAGQTAQVTSDQANIIIEPIDDPRFVSQWAALVNAPKLEGKVTFEPAMPTALGVNETEADTIMVYLERTGVMLTEDATVTLNQPGHHDRYADLAQQISAGRVIDSYFVHFDPQLTKSLFASAQGRIQFDRPILGIIATGEHVAQSHEIFGLAGVTYASTNIALANAVRDPTGLETSNTDPSQTDRIHISDDRRTLTLNLYSGEVIDQFRVLVASKKEPN